MHIALIGGSGRVSNRTLDYFLNSYATYANKLDNKEAKKIKITVASRNPPAVEADIREIQQTILAVHGRSFDGITTTVTSEYSKIAGADLVVCLAHTNPNEELKSKLALEGVEHRDTLSYGNRDLIQSLGRKIMLHAPKAHVVLVTNQSDVMAGIMRDYIPPYQVLGFGGSVDSIRLRHWLTEYYKNSGKDATQLREMINKCHMVGYHSQEMLALASSVNTLGIDPQVLLSAVDQTRNEGFEMTQMRHNGAPATNQVLSPYVVPAKALSSLMEAFSGIGAPKEDAFNVVLNGENAKNWGVRDGCALSVPVKISEGEYSLVEGIVVSNTERKHFRRASIQLSRQVSDVRSWPKPKRQVINSRDVSSEPRAVA